MRSNINRNNCTDPRARTNEQLPFGLTSTIESYPLVVEQDNVGEVRFLRNFSGELRKIEIFHKSEFDRIGIPGGFSVEPGIEIEQAEFDRLLRPEGGVLFTLNQVVNAVESYPYSTSEREKGLLVHRHTAAWFKEAKRCDVNDTEFLQYYRDCLPVSLVDWAAGCRRTESQILRRNELGLTSIECHLITNHLPEGGLTADIRVFTYGTGSCLPDLLVSSQGVVRRREDTEQLLRRISELVGLFELPDPSKLPSEIQLQVGGIFQQLSPSAVYGGLCSQSVIHTSDGGVISCRRQGGRILATLASGTHKNASKIEFQESGKSSLADTLSNDTNSQSESVLDAILDAAAAGHLVSSLLQINLESSSRVLNVTDNLTKGLPFLQPCGLPPHIFTVPELARTYGNGCDWIGYSDIRFGPHLPLHGTRYAHSIYFKVWEGGCQQILLQLPGTGFLTLSPSESALSLKRSAFIQGGLSEVRDYIKNQLQLFSFNPLYLLRHHLMSRSEIRGGDPRVINELVVPQLQFLSNMLVIEAQRNDSDLLFPTREIHPLTLYLRSSGESSTLRLNNRGPFTIQVTFKGEGLHQVDVIGRSSLARKVMTKQDELSLASTAVPGQIGKCAERSYELLRRLWSTIMISSDDRKHRYPTRNCIWKLIDSQLQEDL
jgi:hypothetical protein